MKKLKRILKLIPIILIIAVIFVIAGYNAYTSLSATSTNKTITFEWMRDIAHKGFKEISSYTVSQVFSFVSSDPSGDDGVWNDCASICCLHNDNKWDQYKDQQPFLIIDINPDGIDPTSAVMYMINRQEKDARKQISSYDLSSTYYKTYLELAYIAAHAEMLDHSTESKGVSADSTYSDAFRTAWMNIYQYLQSESGNTVTFPYATEGFYSTDYPGYIEALNYANSWTKSTETTYSARIIVFQGGSNETRAILLGVRNTNLVSKVNKYISSIKVPQSYEFGTLYDGTTDISGVLSYQDETLVVYKPSDGSTDWYYSRVTFNDKYKLNIPVQVTPYTYVTYTITASVNISRNLYIERYL